MDARWSRQTSPPCLGIIRSEYPGRPPGPAREIPQRPRFDREPGDSARPGAAESPCNQGRRTIMGTNPRSARLSRKTTRTRRNVGELPAGQQEGKPHPRPRDSPGGRSLDSGAAPPPGGVQRARSGPGAASPGVRPARLVRARRRLPRVRPARRSDSGAASPESGQHAGPTPVPPPPSPAHSGPRARRPPRVRRCATWARCLDAGHRREALSAAPFQGGTTKHPADAAALECPRRPDP